MGLPQIRILLVISILLVLIGLEETDAVGTG